MKTMMRLLTAAMLAAAASTGAMAAGDYKSPEPHTWSFEGPFGQFDRNAVQRGFQVYQEVCAACHGLQHLSIRHLGEEGGPFHSDDFPNPNDNPIIQAIAAEYIVMDGPDEFGDMFERPGRPADGFPYPYENQQQGRAANGGAYPPDLSVIVKARKGGPEYIRSLMLGYDYEVPTDLDVRPGNYYNPYKSGQIIAMPPQLQDDLIEYADGTPATKEQMAHDITAFLAWAAEPHMEARKRMGLMVMIYLLILAGLLWASYRQIWSRVSH
ncbi:MAG: cytochrome c1 [Pseudomonadota bacterium]